MKRAISENEVEHFCMRNVVSYSADSSLMLTAIETLIIRMINMARNETLNLS